jgi:hypothetical protein
VQIHPAALPLDLIDLAFTNVLTAGLEGEDLQVARQVLEPAAGVHRPPPKPAVDAK